MAFSDWNFCFSDCLKSCQAKMSADSAAAKAARVPGSSSTPAGTVRTCKEVTCQRSLEFDLVRFTWNVENFTFYRDSRGVTYDVLESPRKHFSSTPKYIEAPQKKLLKIAFILP
jgi:hypothetical protein